MATPMDKGTIKKGFKQSRAVSQRTNGTLRSIRSCKSCVYLFADGGEKEEKCHNSNVTKFDMTIEESGVEYCTFFRPVGMKSRDD